MHMPPRAPNSIDIAVGRNVRIRRLAKGLSQKQLGTRVGLTFQQVQKYEAGANRIGSGRLVRIAKALDVPVATLFESVDGATDPGAASLLRLLDDARAFRLAQAFAAIRNVGFRRSIVDMVARVAAAVPGRRRRGK
jgi:transcriptional regulator with XRE-family HTH domain